MMTNVDYPALTDCRLVALHLDGDREAFRQIVERYQGMVCALAMSACGSVERSEDVAQEVFIVAWKQLPELREPAKLRGWLGGITRNLAQTAVRRQRRTPTAQAEMISDETPGGEESPREQAATTDEAALMWRVLAGIPETYREPMVLFYREGRSTEAVAAALEISEDLVRQRLARGRGMLNARMAALVEETLVRTAPTGVFAGEVMLAMPLMVGPAVVVLETGAASGAVAKTMTTAGVVGGAVAKGGLAVKAISLLAVLPALLGGFEDFIKFRARHKKIEDARERRRVAWAYLTMNAAVGAATLGFFVVPSRFGPNPPKAYYVCLGVGIIAAFWISVLAKRRVNRDAPAEEPWPTASGADELAAYERLSAMRVCGLPLWHVRLGSKCGWRRPVVRAWIAVSDGRSVGVLFALGKGAVAPISMGVGAAGIFSLGVFSAGGCAIGLAAVGWVGCGVVAAGTHAAKGIFAAAGELAVGFGVAAPHANDVVARAFFHEHGFLEVSDYVGRFAMAAAMLGWVVPLVLTGRQLARRKT